MARRQPRRSSERKGVPARREGGRSGATTGKLPLSARFMAWLRLHAQMFFASLGRLWRNPLSSLMTAAVIGIALALPTGLYVVLTNLQSLTGGWDGGARISLFLRLEVTEERVRTLGREIAAREGVGEVEVIDRARALAEFRRLSGFGDALDALEENPLPAVIVVSPAPGHAEPARVRLLLERLEALPEVEMAQLDMQWVKRLHALMEIARRGILVAGGLLGLAVLLIVGNTIRLEIENRRDEIVITKLIGATDTFIRRPFLYSGMWYGLLGGLIAWGLIALSLGLLEGPVQRLTLLYQSTWQLLSIQGSTIAALLAGGTLLGLGGSWLAVGRHLDSVEPD